MDNLFEYYKTILIKVSFDKRLFKRELTKASKDLLPSHIERLKVWLQKFVTDKPELKLLINEI